MPGTDELAGKVLFVAGVGPQMGSAVARIAAREGAKVVLAARSTDVAEITSAEIRKAGGEALVIKCDVSDELSLRNAVDATAGAFGPIDRVFYNAAFFDNEHDSVDIDNALWQTTMDINFNGALRLAQLTIPAMVKRGNGAFVFNSSSASIVAEGVRFGYQVTKGNLNALTQFIAVRYGRQGIRANAIFPFVDVGETGTALAAFGCIGRTGHADEIGEVVTFLLSDRASIITGQLIHLDGGLFVRAPWSTIKST